MWTLAPSVSGLPPFARVGAIDEKTLEDTGAEVSPLVKTYTEMRELIFKIADEVGIGAEVRTVYYDVATGARIGQALGAILTSSVNPEAVAISALSGGAGTGGAAAVGMSVGTVVGAVIAVIAIIMSDDDDLEARKKRNAEYLTFLFSKMQKRMTIDDLIAEQVELAQVTRHFAPYLPKHTADLQKTAATSDKIALFYKRLKEELPPLQLEIFVSVTNLTRWANFQAKLGGVLGNPALGPTADKLGADDVAATIQILRDAESKNFEALAAKAAADRRIAIQLPDRGMSGWVYVLGAAAALSAFVYFRPALALSLYRSGTRYVRPVVSGAATQVKSLGGKALSKVGM